MSDAQHPPEKPEPILPAEVGAEAEPRRIAELTSDTVMVRRAPRYGAFIALGVLLGAVAALVLTFAFSGEPPDGRLVRFDDGQVFGFLLLFCGVIGAGLGAVVALVLDRVLAGRSAAAIAEHESARRIGD